MTTATSITAMRASASNVLGVQKNALASSVAAAQSQSSPFAGLVGDLMQPSMSPKDASAGICRVEKKAAPAVVAVPASLPNNSFFYGYNGKAYSLAPPTGDSFLASNGQTYTKKQIKDFYANNPNPGDDIAQMAKLGMKFPDLYKARFLAGHTDTNGTGIYTDPKEMTAYSEYRRGAMAQIGSASSVMSFDQWRDTKSPSYLASLQTGPIENIGWLNGPTGGVVVGGVSPNTSIANLT